MIKPRAKMREIAAVRRAQIIQRVLVDGWSAADSAAAFGVRERQVVRWIAAYRRRGMASLRASDGASAGATGRWADRLKVMLAWLANIPPGGFAHREPAPCVVLRRGEEDDDRRRVT